MSERQVLEAFMEFLEERGCLVVAVDGTELDAMEVGVLITEHLRDE